jgi:hypothetical protein
VAWKWRGEVVEHKGEPWALLTGSEDDEPIALEVAARKKTTSGPGWFLCR